MRIHRSFLILAAALVALALAPVASAQQIAMQNSGLDEYTEDVPDTGGESGNVDAGDDSQDNGSSGGDSSDDDSSAESTAPPSDPTATSSGTTTATPTSDGLTEAQATSGSGTTPDGQLPATGLETVVLALTGVGLLALGAYARRLATH